MCYSIVLPAHGGSFQESYDFDSVNGYSHIKQEVMDCLVATRSSYEITTEGVEFVLNNKNIYDLGTSRLDLLYRTEQSSIASIREKQVFVMVRSSAGYIMVACRGTFSLSDIVADIKVAKRPVPFAAQGRAQIGFVERAVDMPIDLFVSLLRAGEKLIFTGHSLGGAVTSLAALRVLEALGSVPRHSSIAQEQVRCITFATAPFANLELAAYVNSKYKSIFHNIVSKHDVVPRAHTLLPKFFFPAAKWVVDRMRARWEIRVCKTMVESMTKMPMDKAVSKLEQKLPSLWPVTCFYRFMKECAAHDEEALFYNHVGYMLMLDPDTKDPGSTISMEDETERLGLEFCLEDKSALEIYYEHGLGNHYSCLVRGLSATKGTSVSVAGEFQRWTRLSLHYELLMNCDTELNNVKAPAAAAKSLNSVRSGLSMQQILRNPPRACLTLFNQFLIRLTGNEFP
ncbi:unnamed protein product [Calypogeia fissa]